MLVIGGIQWSNTISRDLERRQAMMALVADQAAQRAELVLSTAPAVLDVADALAADKLCSPSLSTMLGRYTQFSSFSVVDANGFPLCSTLGVQAASPGAGDREWFKELKRTGQKYIQSSAFMGPVTQSWVIAVAKRREAADGSFAGASLIGVPVSSLAFSLDRSGLPPDSEIALLDISGQVFASRYWARLPEDTMRQVRGADSAFMRAVAQTGEDRDVAIVRLASGPLFALLSSPKPTPIAFDNLSAFSNFALPLFAWLLALVTAWLATDRVVLRWLDYLRRIAGLYASGKLQVQPLRARREAPVEILELADTMETMAGRIKERTQNLETALMARDAAMKEIHHRVKNNLQIINSLLSLQSRKVADPAAIAVLNDVRSRINALSVIHRSLYEHNDIRSVDVKPFFQDLAHQLDQALGAADLGIQVGCRIDADVIDADLAVPLALFTAEAVTNAIKHAFPNARRGQVTIDYAVGPDEKVLAVRDDGVGGSDSGETSHGLGSTLMQAFAKQARGDLHETAGADGGREVSIHMPVARAGADSALG